MAKLLDKSKGPVKTAASSTTTAAGKKKSVAAKARKMGAREKVGVRAPTVLCPQGHPTHIVHHTYLGCMRRWCPTCLEVI